MRRDMEASISSLCGALSDVLSHADSSSRALSDALTRRPIPLDSATTAFLSGLDRRVEAAGADLARLESMAFGTVSVEELLGHCREALNIVSRHADAVEFCLVSFGYVAPGKDFSASPKMPDRKPESESVDDGQEIIKEAEEPTPPQIETVGQDDDAFQGMINASKEQYEKLPPYLRTLASWEELCDAVSKLNSYYGGDEGQGSVALNQDDVGSIGLGRKGRSYLLILLRLNQLAMETIDGSIFYTLRKNAS